MFFAYFLLFAVKEEDLKGHSSLSPNISSYSLAEPNPQETKVSLLSSSSSREHCSTKTLLSFTYTVNSPDATNIHPVSYSL